MNAYVAATDPDWFHFLRDQRDVDEVNFWYPTPWNGRFGVLADGEPLLFKLRRPHNHIAGGGFFKHYTELPLSLAWQTFGSRNGAATHEEVWRRITRLRREEPQPWNDPTIGCVLLVDPFFWSDEEWISNPLGWHPNIQRGRTYDLREGDGKRIWDQVVERLHGVTPSLGRDAPLPIELPGGYSDPVLQRRRLGQGTFSALVRDVYERRCAVTAERALPALEAAHIRPFHSAQQHVLTNGILLRSDVHRLFDAGYVTITPEHRVEASRRMKEDFDDGDNYLQLHGKEVWVPLSEGQRPNAEALRWHNERVYRG